MTDPLRQTGIAVTTAAPTPPDLTIAPDRIHWRIIASLRGGTIARVAPYIDARDAMDKLDALDPGWSDSYRVVTIGTEAGLECCITAGGVTRCDVGVTRPGRGASPEMAPIKAAYSDALKRAAVKHGIGRELYMLPDFYVPTEADGGKAKRPTALPSWDPAAERWKPAPGGWITYEESARIDGDVEAATATEVEVQQGAANGEDPRQKRIDKIKRLIDFIAGAGIREINQYSIRSHLRGLAWDDIDTLPKLYARGTIEQLNEIGAYVAGKAREVEELQATEADQDNAPKRAEDMTDEEAMAAGTALLQGGTDGY